MTVCGETKKRARLLHRALLRSHFCGGSVVLKTARHIGPPCTAPTAYVTPLVFPVSSLLGTSPATYKSELRPDYHFVFRRTQRVYSPASINLHFKFGSTEGQINVVLDIAVIL